MYLIYSVTNNNVVSINDNIFPNAFTINKRTEQYILTKKKSGKNILVMDFDNYMRAKTQFFNTDYFVLYNPEKNNPTLISINDTSFSDINILYNTLSDIEKLDQQEIFIIGNIELINFFVHKVEFILQILTSVNTLNIPIFSRLPSIELQKFVLETTNLTLISSNIFTINFERNLFGNFNVAQYNLYQNNIFNKITIDNIQNLYINVISNKYVIGTQLNIDIPENKFFKWNDIYFKYRQDIFLIETIKELYDYISFNYNENIIEYNDCEKLEKCNFYKILYKLHNTYYFNINEFKLNSNLIFNEFNMIYIPSFNITFIRKFNNDGYYDLYGIFNRVKEINIYGELPICLNTLLIVMYYFELVFNNNIDCKYIHKLKRITLNCNYIYISNIENNIINTNNLENGNINVVEWEPIDKKLFTHIIVPVLVS
jgi:hypothetical protein